MDYKSVFKYATESAVHAFALTHIRSVTNNEKITDKEQFEEILTIMNEAIQYLDDEQQ